MHKTLVCYFIYCCFDELFFLLPVPKMLSVFDPDLSLFIFQYSAAARQPHENFSFFRKEKKKKRRLSDTIREIVFEKERHKREKSGSESGSQVNDFRNKMFTVTCHDFQFMINIINS